MNTFLSVYLSSVASVAIFSLLIGYPLGVFGWFFYGLLATGFIFLMNQISK